MLTPNLLDRELHLSILSELTYKQGYTTSQGCQVKGTKNYMKVLVSLFQV